MDVRLKVALRVGAVVLVTLAAGYVLSLLSLALANRQAREAEFALLTEVAALETSVPALETATYQLQTDEGIEAWAREKQKWARKGDHVIVVVPPTGTPPAPASPPASSDNGLHRLLRWLRGG